MENLLAAIVLSGFLSLYSSDGLEVRLHSRSFQVGEVVLVEVRGDKLPENLTCRVFKKKAPFHCAVDRSRCSALVGVDLKRSPGPYDIRIEAGRRDVPLATRTFQVRSRAFPTRRLSVAPRYVDPPRAVRERISRESKKLQEVWKTTSPRRYWEGGFGFPVPGRPNSSFGKRSILNGKERNPHTGADFRAAEGTPVMAPNAGRVVLAEDLYYSGNAVIVDHGQGLYSTLIHLSRIDVRVGQDVERGDIVGLSGSTGRVTGPHLHWSVRLQQARVDPVSLVEVTGGRKRQ